MHFSVSLTFDIWIGRAKKWHLEKKIIEFELIEAEHTHENIDESIVKVAKDWSRR